MNFTIRDKNIKYNSYGIHMGNVQMFFAEPKDIEFDTRMGAIRAYTSCNPFRHMKYNKMGFKLQRENHDKYRLWFGEKFLEFSRFSDVLTGNHPIKLIPYKLELLTHDKRKGECYFRSFYFFNSLGGILETSYVDDSSGKVRVVHSYIRRKNKIIDYASNLVISEKDYEDLVHPTVLNQVSHEEYLSDRKSPIVSLPMGLKFYCLLRNELLNGHTFLGGEEWEVSDGVKQKTLGGYKQ